ncbi:MAG: NADPH-dependent glutamate synthase [Planctomycetota bacterium]|nr:NADPH-dependent glutamate synthase [Planctomycetota bacterium]
MEDKDKKAEQPRPKPKPKKQRPPRQPMPEQSAKRRARNFEEVPYGYAPETAIVEADRCLQCKKPLCVAGCPVGIDIPGFIKLIAESKFQEAAAKLLEQTALPAVCGRVCPQESQCEAVCVLGKKFEPVAIGRLERFAADYVREHGGLPEPEFAPPTGKKVAIIGAGPAGITVAGDLARLGHKVVIYEALHLTGGVLMYGIPQFRLPKEIVQYEVNNLKKMGVEIHTDYVIGKTETVDQLLNEEGFDAVFVGAGAGLPMFLNIPGENAIGVFSANEFLTRINLMKAYDFPNYATSPIRAEHIITVGGGNVAMDSARCALRLGAKSTVVYRRAREQMPAREEEIHHAEEEGVVFNLLTNPTRILVDDNNQVVGMECLRMELGEPDDSGRRRPVAVEGSEFIIDADAVVVSIGNSPNPLIPQTSPELDTTRWGTLVADEKTMQTTIPGVFAGGDVVSGAATVISAMGQAKIAARAIHRYVMGEPLTDEEESPAEEEAEEAPAK